MSPNVPTVSILIIIPNIPLTFVTFPTTPVCTFEIKSSATTLYHIFKNVVFLPFTHF